MSGKEEKTSSSSVSKHSSSSEQENKSSDESESSEHKSDKTKKEQKKVKQENSSDESTSKKKKSNGKTKEKKNGNDKSSEEPSKNDKKKSSSGSKEESSVSSTGSEGSGSGSGEPLKKISGKSGKQDAPEIDASRGVHLRWKDIKFEVVSKKTHVDKKWPPCSSETNYKKILRGVSGEVLPGEMCAIIGPSGAGKTSFLNILARRVKNTATNRITGTITVNEQAASHAYFKQISGFVAQEDILMGSLTPWEALLFTATLSLGNQLSKEEIIEKVHFMLEGMGLLHVKDNFIGFVGAGSHRSGIERGLSGGERKRVSVCVELIHNPLLLFLDEPTSGLDSYAAKTVISCLRGLADQGRTVICTIHQPAAELLKMFDKLLILGSGNIVYFGPTVEAPDYFKYIKHPVPKFCNPADHYLTVVQLGGKKRTEEDIEEGVSLRDAVIDHTELADMFKKSKYGKLVAEISDEVKGKSSSQNTSASFCCGANNEGDPVSFSVQMKELVKRSIKNVFREPLLFKIRIFQTLFMGILSGLIFLRIPNSLTGASNKISGGFFVAVNPLISGLNGPTATFASERAVYWRENGAGLYSVGAYFLSKLAAEIPVNLLSPILFASVSWWIMGLNDNGDRFLIFILIQIIITTLGYALGIVLTMSVYDPGIVQRIQPLILLPLMVFAGFFINTTSVPVWLIWLQDISPLKYAFRATMNVVMSGESYYCSTNDFRELSFVSQSLNSTADPKITILNSTSSALICPITSGDQFLSQLGMAGYDVWVDIIIVACMSIFFFILSFILLWCRKPNF